MNTYIHEIILKLDVEIKDTPQSSFKSQNSKISTTKSVESHASILNSERQKFMKKFSFVDEETKSLYWNKALKLLKNKTAKRDFSRKNEPILNASILNNSINTFEREKIELQNWKEKYTSCEAKMQTMKKQYEAMLQEKCKKIQELEIENKLLKKRCEKPAKSALPHEEGCSPLMDVINQNQKRRITKSEYLNSYNPEKELKKLKEDYNKLYQEKQVLKTEYEVYKSNKENETILISQNAERQASDNNIKYILKTQIEENKKFRHMLGNLIDSKNKKALLEDIKADHDRQSFKEFELKIKEILNSNSILDQQKSIELEKRLDELHSK